jgi:hypothetical protein
MARNTRVFRRIAAAVLIGVLELTAVAAVGFVLDTGAYAQRYRRSGPGFFESLFGPGNGRDYGPVERAPAPVAPVESSRAPPPRKSDTTPTITVMVMGDELADWLAYGLEDAFSDTPEIGVVRKTKAHSGLIRYDSKSDLDWWHVARDDVAGEKADYIVMMLGVEDRQNIRDVPPPDKKPDKKAAEAGKKPGQDKNQDKGRDKKADQKSADQNADDEAPDDEAGDDAIIAAEPKRGIRNGVAEFRSEAWEQIYTKRIDDTIAAMKSKGVPVLWVGLPSIRGTKSTADAVYLNDLYRARAEKAGIVYVDIWDGFVDENGKFSYYGPDFEGQNRRLRAGDGVNFTKSGARKLAHYVERELRRFIANRALPVSLPAGTQGPALGSPAARPVAGPVLPLTGSAGEGNELLGGNTSRPALSDPVATQVLVKGEPIAPATGRADDFHWPRDGKTPDAAPSASAPAAISPAPAKPAVSVVKPAKTQSAQEAKREPAAKSDQATKPVARTESKVEAKPQMPKQAKPAPRPDQKTVDRTLRPPAPIQQQPPRRRNNDDGGLFGLFR